MSRWFEKTFLPSFNDCENRKISEKQFDVFARELDECPYGKVERHCGEVSSRYIDIIRAYYAGNAKYPMCYVTIRTIDESAANIWERWEKHYEELFDTVEDDVEADQIEYYIGLCHEVKRMYLGYRKPMTDDEVEEYLK